MTIFTFPLPIAIGFHIFKFVKLNEQPTFSNQVRKKYY